MPDTFVAKEAGAVPFAVHVRQESGTSIALPAAQSALTPIQLTHSSDVKLTHGVMKCIFARKE